MQDPKNLLNVKKYKHFVVANGGDIVAGHEYLTDAIRTSTKWRGCKIQSRYFCERVMNR